MQWLNIERDTQFSLSDSDDQANTSSLNSCIDFLMKMFFLQKGEG